MLPARPLLTRRRHWRNRRRVRRRASGRSVYNYFRDYDAVTGRYVETDPVGLAGGLNPYLYVDGNPLRYADPLGLDPVEVIFWNPVGIGRSSFGHVSAKIGDASYSWTPGGLDARPFRDYLALQQNFRGGYGLVIDVPAESLSRIQKILDNYGGPYSAIGNNCTAPIQEAFGQEFGFGRPGTPTAGEKGFLPRQLDRALRGNFNVIEQRFYPGP